MDDERKLRQNILCMKNIFSTKKQFHENKKRHAFMFIKVFLNNTSKFKRSSNIEKLLKLKVLKKLTFLSKNSS